jgi:hypothetical protein
MSSRLRTIHLGLAAAAAAFMLWTAIATRPFPYGDGPEYLLMAESFVNHRSFDLRAEDERSLAERYWRDDLGALPRIADLGYVAAPDGARYCYHFWAYSFSFLPVKLALRAVGGDELKAPQIWNALLMVLLFVRVFLHAPLDETRKLLLSGLLFFSPALWFVLWPHPEVLSFTFAAMALLDSQRGRHALAVGEAAVAALQNPQLMLLAGVLWARGALRARVAASAEGAVVRVRTRWRDAAAAALPALLFLPHPLFFLWTFGRASVVAEELAPVSLSRAWGLVVDLNVGLLPYVPLAVVLFLFVTARAAWERRGITPSLPLAFAFALVLLANTLQTNYNHGSSGPSRYVVWLAPVVFLVPLLESRTRAERRALAAAVAVQAAIVVSRGGMIPRYDYLQHSPAAVFVLDRWPALYNPDYQVFIKRTLHEEGRPTHGPYVYRASNGECRKVLAHDAHGEAIREACGRVPERYRTFFETGLRSADARRTWTYVNF